MRRASHRWLQGNSGWLNSACCSLRQTPPANYPTICDADLTGAIAWHHLGIVYREQGRLEDAERAWRTALDRRPDYAPAWRGWGEICFQLGRWNHTEHAAIRLESRRASRAAGLILHSRVMIARAENSTAQAMLQEAIELAPLDPLPRLLMAKSLLYQGEIGKGRASLTEVLLREPTNPHALSALEQLSRSEAHHSSSGVQTSKSDAGISGLSQNDSIN